MDKLTAFLESYWAAFAGILLAATLDKPKNPQHFIASAVSSILIAVLFAQSVMDWFSLPQLYRDAVLAGLAVFGTPLFSIALTKSKSGDFSWLLSWLPKGKK